MLTDNAINAVSEYTNKTPIQKLFRLKALYSKEDLNDEEKDEISHRKIALNKLKNRCRELFL